MKLTKKQLSNLIKEEYNRQNRLTELKRQKKAVENKLKKLDEIFGRESGYYAPGTEHDPNAPWNQADPEMMTCTCCEGTGVDEVGEECVCCDGTGEVEDDGSNVDDSDGHDEWISMGDEQDFESNREFDREQDDDDM